MSAAGIEKTNGHGMTDAEARAAARKLWLEATAAGQPLSGVDLGQRFDRTDRWGRKQIEHARHQSPGSDRTNGTPRFNGTDPSRTRNDDQPAPKAPEQRLPADRSDEPGGPRRFAAPVDKRSALPEDNVPSPVERPGRAWLDGGITLAVAAVAAAASYGHMLEVALYGSETLWIARTFPITVDGLVLAALRRGRDGRHWLALGIAVSIAVNILSRFPELAADAGPIISAWPPLALYGTHRLLHNRPNRSEEGRQ